MRSVSEMKMQSYQNQHKSSWGSEKADDIRDRREASVLKNRKKRVMVKDIYYYLDLRDGKMPKKSEKTQAKNALEAKAGTGAKTPQAINSQLDVYA